MMNSSLAVLSLITILSLSACGSQSGSSGSTALENGAQVVAIPVTNENASASPTPAASATPTEPASNNSNATPTPTPAPAATATPSPAVAVIPAATPAASISVGSTVLPVTLPATVVIAPPVIPVVVSVPVALPAIEVKPVEVKEAEEKLADCEAKLKVISEWETGYIAEIVMLNTGAEFKEWNVNFSLPGKDKIVSLWNGEITSQKLQNVSVKNLNFGGWIFKNFAITLHIQVSREKNSGLIDAKKVLFNGLKCKN